MKILIENIKSTCSLGSELSFLLICSVRNRSRTRDIAKKLPTIESNIHWLIIDANLTVDIHFERFDSDEGLTKRKLKRI